MSMYDRLSKQIDLNLVNKVIYTTDKFEREYYTVHLMRKGKRVEQSTEDLFVPARYRIQ